jgi:hypothetical protein
VMIAGSFNRINEMPLNTLQLNSLDSYSSLQLHHRTDFTHAWAELQRHYSYYTKTAKRQSKCDIQQKLKAADPSRVQTHRGAPGQGDRDSWIVQQSTLGKTLNADKGNVYVQGSSLSGMQRQR